MRAIAIDRPGAPPALRDDVCVPTPGPGGVLVRVHASSINPIDRAIAAGAVAGAIPHAFPVTLGRDFAGVVEQVGDGVEGVSAGDAVFGVVPLMAPEVHAGAWAELVVADAQTVARTPAGVDMTTAGAAAWAGVTALQTVDALALAREETVLVVGATGGVGSVVVQLLAAAGVRVVAPANAEDERYLLGLGVAEVLPRDDDVVASVRARHADGVDAVADLVSLAPGAYDSALAGGGRVVSTCGAAGEGPGRVDVVVAPAADALEALARHLADGSVRIDVQRIYDLAQTVDALGPLQLPHVQGKLAVRIA